MPDTKITALTAISTVDPAVDVLPIVDVSDTTMAASGTTKKITSNQILGAGGTATLASATITGDLTVDTSTLKVDSANNRVGFGTASPLYPLHLVGEFGLEEASAGNGSKLRMIGQSTKYNFRLGKQIAVDNAFEITPSTAAGGTTFSNPVYTVTYDGIHTFLDGAGGTRMTLNSTGLGVGVTPSAWWSSTKALQISNSLALAGRTDTAGRNYLASNAYLNSTPAWTYIASSTAAARYDQNDGSHQWHIAPSSGVSGAGTAITFTQAMTLDASGNLLVGKTASSTTVAGSQVQPDGTFSAVKGDANPGFFYNRSTAASGTIALFRSNSVTVGSITQDGTNTSYVTSSDYRLKDSIQPLSGGLARVNSLKPSIYTWKTNGSSGEGFLAHELAEVVPSAVVGTKDAVDADGNPIYQGVDLSKVVPILVAAIKELTARVEALEA